MNFIPVFKWTLWEFRVQNVKKGNVSGQNELVVSSRTDFHCPFAYIDMHFVLNKINSVNKNLAHNRSSD